MLGMRWQAYQAAADCCLDTTGHSPAETAVAIARILAEGTVSPADADEGLAMLRRTDAAGEYLPAMAPLPGRPTRLYGIIGYPSRHSKSPGMYTQLFARYGIDGFYASFESPDPAAVIGALERLDYRGLSVTIPHKAAVMPLLDRMDEHAAAIGAVNTIVRCGDETTGYNTDWLGVRRPVEDLAGASAVLIGAGGAAAAAAYALADLDMDVLVLARTKAKAEALAARFHCRAGALREEESLDADLVVHATPVGMAPDASSLLAAEQLPKGCTVFDLVYTPPETPLLREARRAGCRTIPGTEMFVHQACEQFALFTGIRVPPQEIREMIA
jgi:shikimate dehydrogenase